MSMLRNGNGLVNVKFVLSLGKKLVKFELNKLPRLWNHLRSQSPSLSAYTMVLIWELKAESWELKFTNS